MANEIKEENPLMVMRDILEHLDVNAFTDGKNLRSWDELTRVIKTKTDEPVVLLVGSTGSGKSTVFNSLSGRYLSDVSGGLASVTTLPIATYLNGPNNERWILVDTMGLSDTRNEKISQTMIKSTFSLFPQVNTIILTLRGRLIGQILAEIDYLFTHVWDPIKTIEDVQRYNFIIVRNDYVEKNQQLVDDKYCRDALSKYIKASYSICYLNVSPITLSDGPNEVGEILGCIYKSIPKFWAVASRWSAFSRLSQTQASEIGKDVSGFLGKIFYTLSRKFDSLWKWWRGNGKMLEVDVKEALIIARKSLDDPKPDPKNPVLILKSDNDSSIVIQGKNTERQIQLLSENLPHIDDPDKMKIPIIPLDDEMAFKKIAYYETTDEFNNIHNICGFNFDFPGAIMKRLKKMSALGLVTIINSEESQKLSESESEEIDITGLIDIAVSVLEASVGSFTPGLLSSIRTAVKIGINHAVHKVNSTSSKIRIIATTGQSFTIFAFKINLITKESSQKARFILTMDSGKSNIQVDMLAVCFTARVGMFHNSNLLTIEEYMSLDLLTRRELLDARRIMRQRLGISD